MTGTKHILIIERGIHRKVSCPISGKEVELFYDCRACPEYRGLSSDRECVQCAFGLVKK